MSLGRLWSLFIAAHLLPGFWRCAAQTSDANCSPSYNWTFNSLGQSPCVIAAYLEEKCTGTVVNIPSLSNLSIYPPPSTNENNPCECSSVTYSLMSACALCQGGMYDTWSDWSANCSPSYPGVYIGEVPEGTEIPSWTYVDVVIGNSFNPSLAEEISKTNSSESGKTATSAPSPTPSSTSSTGITKSSKVPMSSATSHKNDAGSIAGGVIGGVVFIALLASLILWWIMRRRRARAPSAQYKSVYGTTEAGLIPAVRPSSYSRAAFPPPGTLDYKPDQKTYDPPDHATSPTTSMLRKTTYDEHSDALDVTSDFSHQSPHLDKGPELS